MSAGGVRPRVRQQVVEHLADAAPRRLGRSWRLGGELDRTARLDDASSVDGLPHDRREVDGLPFERAALVEAGEQEQVVDEQAHPLGLARNPRHRALEILGTCGGAAAEQLGVGAHGRQRRPQLVRRVGDEAAQPPVRRLDVVEHRVQRATDTTDLGLRDRRWSTRCERSPAVIASAVSSIRRSGRRPSRTTQSASATSAAITAAVAINSISSSRCKVLETPDSEPARTRTYPGCCRSIDARDAVAALAVRGRHGEVRRRGRRRTPPPRRP